MWVGDLRKYRNSGAKSNVPKLTQSVSKYKIGQEHKVYQMKIYLVTKWMFIEDISRVIIKFEEDWEVVG
jgi:hypothetical protein